MKVLVCGGREWSDVGVIYDELIKLPSNTTIIHGACKGADMIAGAVAKDIGFKVKSFPADWKKHGKSAGYKRNSLMLEKGPELVIAFHSDIEESKGTKMMIKLAKGKGVETRLITGEA